jgi:endonuclease YncB( thermonuclease family)
LFIIHVPDILIKADIKSVRKFLLFLLVLSTFCGSLTAGTFTGKCVGISDGDTILVMKGGRAIKIRLEGIDCPELGQDFGTRAKRFTSNMVFRKLVDVKEHNQDEYGRIVARVYIDGKDLSLELVKAGLAWRFRRNSLDLILNRTEVQARKQKIGLWSMPNPIPPWEFRRRHLRRT